ncbi:MAG: SOS response-associated peptidase family protein [Methyloligellaceae bacterium]
MNLYSQTASLIEVQRHFRLKIAGHIPAFRRNLFLEPGNVAPLVTVGEGYKRELETGQWGLISSSKGCITSLSGMDIPKWHSMMEPPRRCLIPATSFAAGGDPTWFCFEDDLPFSLFALAGVQFRREGRLHFLPVTVPGSRVVQPYAREMPMILSSDEYACWLHAPWDFASELVDSYNGQDLQVVNANRLAKVG